MKNLEQSTSALVDICKINLHHQINYENIDSFSTIISSKNIINTHNFKPYYSICNQKGRPIPYPVSAGQYIRRVPLTIFISLIFFVGFLAPKITNTKLIYDVPDDGSTKTTFSCDATGFPQPEIQWMLGKVTLPTGTTYPVNITDVPNANLTASNDGSLEVMSNNRDGGFGVDVVCFANNTDGNTEENFLVRFLKGM